MMDGGGQQQKQHQLGDDDFPSLISLNNTPEEDEEEAEETAEVREPLVLPFLLTKHNNHNHNNHNYHHHHHHHYRNSRMSGIRNRMSQLYHTIYSIFELPDMSVKDSLKLSFWQKFIKKKRFPFKFVIHLLLVVFVTVQVYMFAGEREEYLYSSGTTIVNRFLPDGFQEIKDSRVGYARYSFFKMDDVVNHVEETVMNYYDFANNSMDYFVYTVATDGSRSRTDYNHADLYQVPSHDVINLNPFRLRANNESSSSYTVKPIKMVNTLYSTLDLDIQMDLSKPLNKKIRTEIYHLTPAFPSPFNTDVLESPGELQSYFHRLIQMKLEFDFRTIFIKREYPEVLVWSVSLTYNFEDRGGQVPLLAKYDVSLCLSNRDRISFSQVALSPITWVCIFVVVLSLASIFLVLRAMLYSCRLVRKAKKDAELKYYTKYGVFPDDDQRSMGNVGGVNSDLVSQAPTTPGDQSEIFIGTAEGVEPSPSLKQRLSLFSAWYLLTLIGNIIGVASSLVVLANVTYLLADLKPSYVLLGLSSIFTWSAMVQYFAHNPKFYILVTALRNGFPNVVRFIIGSLPIFIGYGLCGMLFFGSYSQYFQGLENSMVSLFAAANGDVMLDTFDTIYGQNTFLAFLSRIYLVSFVCMFTYSVLKIFILIMEDAYFAVRGDLISNTIQQQFQQNVADTVANRIEEYEEAKKSRHGATESDISKIDMDYDSYEDECSSVSSPTNFTDRKLLKKKRKMLKLLDQLASGKLDGNERLKDTAQILVQYITLPVAHNKKSFSRSVPTSFKPNQSTRVSFSLESPTRSKSKQMKSSTLTPSKSILKDSEDRESIANRDS